ncbi:MAG TPA: MgtC/SapB family protein [Candidatus Polarisedimenticolaceae bacterium]|nr:MgtC/SapB family protein [Candidatus Polarisedimenticolaceae bacterium]
MFDTAKLFLLSLALGLLVGIERERSRALEGRGTAFGARTMALVALLGTLAAHVGPPVAIVLAAFVAALTVATYLRPGDDGHHDAGTTTEVAAILTFGLGWLAHQEPRLAAMLGVIVVLVLWLKPRIHAFAHEELTNREVNAALLFLVIALVVLPLLPDRTVDPWGVINPSRLWFMFTLIAGVGFAGYIAVRALGPARGLAAAGFFAGLVSSTAATLSLARRAKDEPEFAVPLATGIVLANAASASAQALVVGVTDPALLRAAIVLVGAPVAVGIAGALVVVWWRRRHAQQKAPAAFELSNPLELKPALAMAAAFGGVLVLSALAQRRFGDSGVLVTAGLAGTTDVHAATLAASTLAAEGTIPPAQALLAMLIAFLVNMAVKLSIVATVGTRRLFFIVAPPLLGMAAAAIGAYLLLEGRV